MISNDNDMVVSITGCLLQFNLTKDIIMIDFTRNLILIFNRALTTNVCVNRLTKRRRDQGKNDSCS